MSSTLKLWEGGCGKGRRVYAVERQDRSLCTQQQPRVEGWGFDLDGCCFTLRTTLCAICRGH